MKMMNICEHILLQNDPNASKWSKCRSIKCLSKTLWGQERSIQESCNTLYYIVIHCNTIIKMHPKHSKTFKSWPNYAKILQFLWGGQTSLLPELCGWLDPLRNPRAPLPSHGLILLLTHLFQAVFQWPWKHRDIANLYVVSRCLIMIYIGLLWYLLSQKASREFKRYQTTIYCFIWFDNVSYGFYRMMALYQGGEQPKRHSVSFYRDLWLSRIVTTRFAGYLLHKSRQTMPRTGTEK